ncbi:unnamed protein product [Eruca vesicaria subsp. sativa]|uniref:Uncharacterized protein n=1 Tax=Eruca vesicaria subsp. sativa TaxID=29727 RepID=A0ABC8J6A5_ERUVS|nr:unnamed protein product [Eruca vesicaria subsp. sativa]
MRHWPFKVVHGPGDKLMIVVSYKREEKQFSPEVISSMVFQSLTSSLGNLTIKATYFDYSHVNCRKSPRSYGRFTVEERPGERLISLKRKFGDKEDIKVEATLFNRSVLSSKYTITEPEFVLHITFVVNISKSGAGEDLEIMCSAWPDKIGISKLCVCKGINSSPSFYGGPEFECADNLILYLEH